MVSTSIGDAVVGSSPLAFQWVPRIIQLMTPTAVRYPVNPEISSGLPIPELNRNPAPASRPELYATPATEASDIAFNPVNILVDI